MKGKAEPVRVFQPLAPRARFGTDLTRTHTSPFVGREIDLALLKGIFDKAVASASVQLVTVVGEPGLGKSRIVAELFGYIDARPELVTWRQGRCLPYGEGITFWALGEIVKAHAGILESDDPATAMAKLDVVLPEGEERAWFRQRLLPLLGIGAPPRRSARSCSPRGGGSSSTSPRPSPRCWCSRICTGRTMRCSHSWNTWRIAPRASRC